MQRLCQAPENGRLSNRAPATEQYSFLPSENNKTHVSSESDSCHKIAWSMPCNTQARIQEARGDLKIAPITRGDAYMK
jgi:hypothetical protein